MKRAALILALATCGCSSEQKAVPANEAAAASEPAATAPGYALRSNIEGASLVKVAELPKTTPLPADGNCEHFIEPVSAGARQATQKGWRVLQEERFDPFQAVLIARGGDPMTSGRCNYLDSNVAFFEGDRLVGILYPKGKDSTAIAGLELVDGHLRMWSTSPGALGQVNFADGKLTYDAIAGGDAVCRGKYRVPTIFNLHYPEARKALIAGGWSPRPSNEAVSSIADYTAYRKLYPELESCAGTGYGECGYTFTAKDGATTLSITTLGDVEDAAVSSYDVACDGKPRED